MKIPHIFSTIFFAAFLLFLSGCAQKSVKATGAVEEIYKPQNGKCSVKILNDESNNYWRVQNCIPIPCVGDIETIVHDNRTGFYYLSDRELDKILDEAAALTDRECHSDTTMRDFAEALYMLGNPEGVNIDSDGHPTF